MKEYACQSCGAEMYGSDELDIEVCPASFICKGELETVPLKD